MNLENTCKNEFKESTLIIFKMIMMMNSKQLVKPYFLIKKG